MIYVLYNPFAGNREDCEEQSRKLTGLYKDEQLACPQHGGYQLSGILCRSQG